MPELLTKPRTLIDGLWPVILVVLFYSFGQYGLVSYFPLSNFISRGALLLFFLSAFVLFFKKSKELPLSRIFALFFLVAVVLNGSITNIILNYLVVLVMAFTLTNVKTCRKTIINLNFLNAVFTSLMLIQVLLVLLDDSFLFFAEPVYSSDFDPSETIKVNHWIQYLGFMTKERFTLLGIENVPRFSGYLSEPSAWLLNVFLIAVANIIVKNRITTASVINILGNLIVMSGVVQMAIVGIVVIVILGITIPFLINFKTYLISMIIFGALIFVILDVQDVLGWYFDNSNTVGQHVGSLNSKSNTIFLRLTNTQEIIREFFISPFGSGTPFSYTSVAGIAYVMYHTGILGAILFSFFIFRIIYLGFQLIESQRKFAVIFGVLSMVVIISFAYLLINKGLNAFTGYIVLFCLETVLLQKVKSIDNRSNSYIQKV